MPADIPTGATSSSGETTAGRVRFETLITDISARLIGAPPEQVHATIVAALEDVRTFFQADRALLIQVSADETFANVSHGSYAEALPAIPLDLNIFDLFPWSRHKLLVERVPVIVRRMADLPPEAAIDRASWDQFSPLRSHFAVPIREEPAVRHLVDMQWVAREYDFPDSYVPRLLVLGEMMVGALHRKQAFDDLRANEERLRTSEERLERAAESARCGLWELDMGTGAIWVTPETRVIYGLDADQAATYDLLMRLVHEADRAALAAAIGKALADGGDVDETYRIIRPDGAVRWIRATGRAGPRQVLLGASIDVTERVEASERAVEGAARVAAAVAAAELGFAESVLTTGEGFADPRLLAMLDIAPEDAPRAEEAWIAHVHGDDRAGVEELERRIRSGEIDRFVSEYRYDHPRRGVTWLRHSARRTLRARGGDVRVISALEDITERKGQEQRLRQALDDVQRLREKLESENVYLREEARRRLGPEHIIGRGPAIRRTLVLAEQVAPTDSTVLLLGETGSGKERFASYIHECSRRRDRPMIRVNCSAIPESLIESELFGREKGAYTGALSKQIGRFELAHGSTLFLDEVGELSVEIQVKLLRVLETHTIERLGNPRPVPVDVRIVAATNGDLAAAVRDGRFREDLFYRLNVFPITVPPLRERPEDIPLFVQAFVDDLAAAMGKRIDDVDADSIGGLLEHDWPGNVRELRNVVERAMILATGPTLRIDAPAGATLHHVQESDTRAEMRTRILQVLQDTGWRIRGPHGAAARLGLNPSTLESRIKRLGLTRPGTGGPTQ